MAVKLPFIFFSFLLLQNVRCSEHECPESLKYTCLECDSDAKCLKCKLGYFLNQGICLQCNKGCLECTDQDKCLFCNQGFLLDDGKCVRCNPNCLSCQFSESYCTSCNDNYILDSNNQCEFKYTLLIFLASLVVLIFLITCCMVLIKKYIGNNLKGKQTINYGSVLDGDILRRPKRSEVVSSVDEIGKTKEEKDLSVVGDNPGGSNIRSFLEGENGYPDGSPYDLITQISGPGETTKSAVTLGRKYKISK